MGREERVRWVRRQEHRQRRLRQVFVRGDSIVLVSLAKTATPDQRSEPGSATQSTRV